MPGVVLTSKLCPKHVEATTYALLAGFQNFGQQVARVPATATNPWPRAQVHALVDDGWVDEDFIQPWLADADALMTVHIKNLTAVC